MKKIIATILFVFIFAFALDAFAARTVCISQQTDTSLTFAFGDADGLSYGLFVAHGATDGGEDKYAWDSFEKIAEIEFDQTSFTYEVPVALRDGRPMRFFLMQTSGVNMAKEFKSITSTGAQWINTGTAPNANWIVDFRFGGVVPQNDKTFFGSEYNNRKYLFIMQNDGGTKFRFYGWVNNSSSQANYTIGGTPQANTDYRLVIDPSNYSTLTGGGAEYRYYVYRALNGAGTFAIFGDNGGGHLASFTFYRMKISADRTPTRDFVPAANAEGDIGLYDQVNNVFYPNQTATPFQTGDELPQGRFGRVIAETPTFRFPRSVSVASATADAVTLAFGNPDGSAYKLYVAYGATDCETRKNAWTSWEEVATIAADATEYTYTLPAALKTDGVYYRFFLVKTDNLPYASELASITSTGAQLVRLDYVPGTDTSVDMFFGDITYENQKAFFGQHWSGTCYLFNMQSSGFRFHGSGTTPTGVAPTASTDYRCRITEEGKFIVEDGTAAFVLSENRTAYPLIDLCVFATHSGQQASKFRLDSMLVKDGDIVVRDLVPVQTSAGKGALFDRASGEVFENVTTTDFTRGAAVVRQGWVIATTEQCLVGSSSAAPVAPVDSITLTEDTDWSAIAGRLVDHPTVNLNGHELHVADYAAFLAKQVVLAGTGNLRVTVSSGATLTFDNNSKPVFNGKLIKDGAGTLVLSGGSGGMAYLEGITVAEGIMKYGATTMFSNNGKTIEVLSGAALDLNGNGDGNAVYYKIAGTGPDGLGALRNRGGDVANGKAQMSGLELTADATVGGTGHLGLINSGYAATTLELNGHTLTIDLAASKGFWICNTTATTGGTVYVRSGIPYFHKTESSLPNVDFVINGANSIYRVNAKGTVRNITLENGGKMDQDGASKTVAQTITAIDSDVPANGNRWVCVADTVLVSNETADVTIYPPFNSNGTYSKLVKKGSHKLTLAISHTENRIDRGVEIFGGTVVMDSTASTKNYHSAISSQPVPVTIHDGGTLDMTKCTQPFKITTLAIDAGGTLLHTADNAITLSGANTFTNLFSFLGTVNLNGTTTFDVSGLYAGANPPAAGETVDLITAGAITVGNNAKFTVVGCPYDCYVATSGNKVELRMVPASAGDPVTIWTVGGNYAFGNTTSGANFRLSLAQSLAADEGWNVQMTGWRTAAPVGASAGVDAWKRHAGVRDLALKTSATRAGLLEGLETYCAAAGDPQFTILACGDTDVADGVADATVLANYKAAVTRIKAALPMTTVIACTIPGATASLNSDIVAWCGTEANVEAVDISSLITTAQTGAECDAVAAAIKAKLVTLTPISWTRPAVTLGAENNVPAAYRSGFTHVRTIEPNASVGFPQDVYKIPYAYAPLMQETGIEKVGYYIELVRRDTGALQAMWIDMDAPGSNWADVAFPVTLAQQKQQTVTKLHVWSNFGGVSQVAADNDSVDGYIEFNPINYSQTERTGDVLAEPWSGAYGFNDTFNTSGSNGHGCFQIMRKYSELDGVLPGEMLFAFNNWGSSSGRAHSMGMGTLANYGNHGYTSSKSLDWTYASSDTVSADVNTISEGAYSYIRIDFWVKYESAVAPARTDLAECVWAGSADSAIATAGNWAEGEGAAATLAGKTILVPSGATPTFTYVGWDPVDLSSTALMMDGAATFPEVGGIYLALLDMGATGKLTYDPTKFTFRLIAPPVFASGAKIALDSKYAANTKGRFLLMTWDNGSLAMSQADLNALFDTASANGADVKVWAENLDRGGRLWLDLDYSGAHPQINVLCVGDSITQGSDSTYGNWRTGLMKKLAAAGYSPVAKGHWKVHSHDICGAEMPDEWVWHSGISGQRLITKGGGGTIDAIENMLDCAGDVDFVLTKLGTNDINSNDSTEEELFPVWTNLVWKTLNRKPHAKFIAGAVVDIAYASAKEAKVIAYNAAMSNAIANATFPAKRAYFADLYTPCYRYSVPGDTSTYITGSFYSNNNLHPDWPGEDKMADTYCAAILGALADDPDFTTGEAETVTETTSGAENNVPAAFLTGMTRARTFDVAANTGVDLASLGYVPYSYENPSALTEDIGRVGYYIELKRKDTARGGYHGLVRWLWVSMDAFGGRTIEDVGVPLTKVNQCVVSRLRVASNMPGIESTSAAAVTMRGWVEFWPSSYSGDASGNSAAPANTFSYDWNDKRSDDMSGFGSMQVHRFTPGEANPAQVMFAFNRWTQNEAYEVGIGNFSHQGKSIDFTQTGRDDTREMMSAEAYEIAKIEIWTGGVGAEVEPSAGYWRPQASGDVWTDAAWKKDGTGANVTLDSDWTANFDGNESVTTPTITVPAAAGAVEVVVDSSMDYTFTGTGHIDSTKFVKDGTGTVVLDAAVLAGTPDIEVREGVVKLSDNATPGAAGTDWGTITVHEGAQFDVNFYDATAGANRPRANITGKKKFVIEGEGPDGTGAITSSRTSTAWNTAFDEIELAGDATIGGNARIEVRGNSKNIVHGPDDATLTIKTNPGTSNYYEGFGFESSTLSVGKVVVAEEGRLKFEGSFTVDVPHGIDLYGKLGFWNGSGSWGSGVLTAIGTGAAIGNWSSTATVGAPVTVANGAKLTLCGNSTVYCSNVVTNRGEISVASGTHYIDGDLVNEGNPVISAGSSTYVYPSKVTGDSRMVVTGNMLWTSGRTDWGNSALDISLSGGGEFKFGTNNDGYGLPKFGKDKVTLTAASGHTGVVYLHPSTSASIDGLTVSGTVGNFRSQGPSNGTDAAPKLVEIRANNLVVSANEFQVGNGSGCGELHVTGERSEIHAKKLSVNWQDSVRPAGSLFFEDGILGIGSDGLTGAYHQPMRTLFSMENGTLRADADFALRRAGMTATFGDPVKGGAVDFDLNGHTVKWGTGLAGASDVTIKGSGAFSSDRPGIQGIPLGKWTVESTGPVDLRNAAGFAGGISLAAGATATVDIAGTNMVEMVAWTWHGNAWDVMRPHFVADNVFTPHVASSLTFVNRPASQITDSKHSNGTGFNYLGEFYVSAEKAGTWSFSHSGATHNGLRIDTTDVDQAGTNSETKNKTIELAEGWHKFAISLYTAGNNPTIGPKSGNSLSATDSYVFKAPGDSDYQPFDTTTVPMRMRDSLAAKTSVRWRKALTYADSAAKYLDIDESEYTTIDVVTNSLQAINEHPSTGTNAVLGACSARFDGYFKVTAENVGVWTFQGQFDDRIALSVDGKRIFASTAYNNTGSGSVALREGWHSFEIRTADTSPEGNTGGASGGRLTADGQTCAIAFKVGSGALKPFDERYLPIAATANLAQKFEATGLGGVIELASGSILTNDVRTGSFCPIYGTLKGAGTLAGPFRFTGEDNCWEISGTGRGGAPLAEKVSFSNADPDALAGLKRVKVKFTVTPARASYVISDALGLTAGALGDVALEVLDEKDNDVSGDFWLTVEDGKLKLSNGKPRPEGFFLFCR